MGTYQLLEMVADQGRHVAVQQHRHLANLVVVWSDAADLNVKEAVQIDKKIKMAIISWYLFCAGLTWKCRLWNAICEDAIRNGGSSSGSSSATWLAIGRIGAHIEVGHRRRGKRRRLTGAVEAMRYLCCQGGHWIHVGGR